MQHARKRQEMHKHVWSESLKRLLGNPGIYEMTILKWISGK